MQVGLNSIPKVDRAPQDEYNPFYAGYISLIPEKDIVHFIMDQHDRFKSYLVSLEESLLQHTYAEGKWTIAQVIGHVIDTERVMAYRAMCISRGEDTPLPGFDQDRYMTYSNFNQRDKASLIREFDSLRQATIEMICAMSIEQLNSIGNANGSECSVRAVISIIGGHLEHHFKMLKEKYI